MSGEPAAASRRRARELALQVLYAIDVADSSRRMRAASAAAPRAAEVGAEDAFETVSAHFESTLGAREFARDLVRQVSEQSEELDALIARHARNWRVERMAVVDRNILRLGAFELSRTGTPAAVVLNEAVDLARRFGGDPSPAFVNGILDAVSRSLGTLSEDSA